jgi:hypothetical protein
MVLKIWKNIQDQSIEYLFMRTIRHFTIFYTFLLLIGYSGIAALAEQDGIALAIVYDTSGSMEKPVASQNGGTLPKYVIANKALDLIVKQIQAYSAKSSRKVQAGLFVFNKNDAKEAVKFGAFDPSAIQAWARNFSSPDGSTPLGITLEAAGRAVLKSPFTRKHVLVITDGMNTVGSDPSVIIPQLKTEATGKNSVLFIHFVAFDVGADLFAPLKRQGVTVMNAVDEKQLNQQIEIILKEKILLEDEEPVQEHKKD